MTDIPDRCLQCGKAWNTINGRYCPDERVGRCVTHDGKGNPACER